MRISRWRIMKISAALSGSRFRFSSGRGYGRTRARNAVSMSTKPPTAILMMNMGGPKQSSEVESFLTRLFSDRDIINLPLQKWTGPLLAKRRAPEVAKQYEEIGGGSPIGKWTDLQGRGMCERLDILSPETAPHKHYITFRYASPVTEDTIAKLREDGVSRAIAFTQYPQYSCTTTGSSINELYRQIKGTAAEQIQWSVIDRWGNHPLLIKAFAKLVKEELVHFSESERSSVVIVFSAHSIPYRIADRGDPYPLEVASTVSRVMEELGNQNPYRLVWQSKVGPLPWLGPQTMDALKGFHRLGHKNIILVPIAFTSDHIETLFELDKTYVENARKLGMKVRRAKALNDEPIFLDALADTVVKHLQSGKATSAQVKLRCPMCTNETCAESKEFFCKY